MDWVLDVEIALTLPVPTFKAQACMATVMPDFSASGAGKLVRQRCAAGALNKPMMPMK
jgi:hypothetical protein